MLVEHYHDDSSSHARLTGPLISIDPTDHVIDDEDYLICVDCMVPRNRHMQVRVHALRLAQALDRNEVPSELYEEVFGGHFAAIILNRKTGALWIARDVAGAKTAYFASSKTGSVIIGTNVHDVAARADLRSLSRAATLHIMTIDYLFDGETLYEGVRELPMGSIFATDGGGGLVAHRHFPLALARTENDSDITGNIASLRDHVLRAHERRSGDENVVLLSGGIDSSVMLCALREVAGRDRVRAITFRVKDTPEDETEYAISLAKHLSVDIERIEVDPYSPDLISDFGRSIGAMNCPYFGRFIFGNFSGTPDQVFFAGQDTRLHTPDLNGIDKLAFQYLGARRNTVIGAALQRVAGLAKPLISREWSTAAERWKRGIVRSLIATDLDDYLLRFFFKINPEKLLRDGYSPDMITDVQSRLKVRWRDAETPRDLYNNVVAVKWGEQYTDDMRYLQDIARINQTHIALPFYDIQLARFSSTLPFAQATCFMEGQSQFDQRKRVKINKVLLREAFRSDMSETLLLRAKAVSRSQHLLFAGTLGKVVRAELADDLARGSRSMTRQLDLMPLVQKFLHAGGHRPEDEIFLTKIYWLAVLANLAGRGPAN